MSAVSNDPEMIALFCVYQGKDGTVQMKEVALTRQADGSYEGQGLEGGTRVTLRDKRVTPFPYSGIFDEAWPVERVNTRSGVYWTTSREKAVLVELVGSTYALIGRQQMARHIQEKIDKLID